MTERHVSIKTWGPWWRRRKNELRQAGMSLCEASLIATHESRVRARMTKIIGQGRARRIRLLICTGDRYEDPQFILIDEISDDLWEQFREIPHLYAPFLRRSWGYV